MTHRYNGINVRRQNGAVLVVALVLLTVLTIIGVSSVSSSSIEAKVAANMQEKNVAFQGGLSRLDFTTTVDEAVSPINYKIAIDPNNPPPVQYCNPADGCPDGVEWQALAKVTYMDCYIDSGSSIEAGKGTSMRLFEAEVEARTNTGTGYSKQRQGIKYPVKACGDEI